MPSSSSQPTLRGTNLVELLAEPRYAKLKKDHGYSLAGVPFVGPADRHRPLTAGKCIISATYTDSKTGAVSWLVQASRKTFSSLKWNRLESMQQRQPASNPEFELVPVPSAKSIVTLRIDIPFSDESTQQTFDTILREAPSPTSFELLTELILVGFDHGGQFDIPSAFLWVTSFPALTTLKVEGRQGAQDICAILQGCPELVDLTVSTITKGYSGADPDEIVHRKLKRLTLVSKARIESVLRNFRFAELEDLNLWMLPEVAYEMNRASGMDGLRDCLENIRVKRTGGETGLRPIQLRLNWKVSDNASTALKGLGINITRFA